VMAPTVERQNVRPHDSATGSRDLSQHCHSGSQAIDDPFPAGIRLSLSALPLSLSTSDRFFSSSRFILYSYERECFEKAWQFIVQQCEVRSRAFW
jgi:hypothetical protein